MAAKEMNQMSSIITSRAKQKQRPPAVQNNEQHFGGKNEDEAEGNEK
jgi:hypothetical protein